jgi:predicted regulator of Ras-like GTPase activity (Roadblock/LC7/MglB family)
MEASALISEDGLMIASALPENIEEESAAGIGAVLLNLGSRVADELKRGELIQVLVQGEHGYIIMSQATDETVLMAITNKAAKLGLIFLEMKGAVKEIKEII